MTQGLRVVVYTAGPLSPVNRVFFERLARDPAVCLTGIVVDEYKRARRPLATRIWRGLKEDGWTWLGWKLDTSARTISRRIALAVWERTHPALEADESYEAFTERTGVPVHRVADIHSESSLALIQALDAELGLIVGGRILKDSVLEIPTLGTLNIHKRKVPEYRGGGPVGYWEVLAGEPAIGVTIHWAVAQVDAGHVMGQVEIPIEECDTLESLRIKADVAGARLYHDVVRDVAAGRRSGSPQDLSKGRTFRAPTEAKVWRLERRLRGEAARRMPALSTQPSWVVRARVLVEYLAVRPGLTRARRRLIDRSRAPISMLFYHVVANRAVNHMCLPLEHFVRQVDFLRRSVGILGIDEAVERLRSGKNDTASVVITFDDGYQDNAWAIEYLRYFGIPATFFVSAGHAHDGTSFAHDRDAGFEASPMRADDVQRLVRDGFIVGSHTVHHEDFAGLDAATMDRVLRESRDLLRTMTGERPEHFSFPIGERDRQVTPQSLALAQRYYRYVYSAFGGYNFPDVDRRHFLRIPSPGDVLSVAMIVDGYNGFRRCLSGDGWGLLTDEPTGSNPAADCAVHEGAGSP